MTEMFGEAWPPMSVPDLAPDDDDDETPISHNIASKVRSRFPLNFRFKLVFSFTFFFWHIKNGLAAELWL